MVQVKDRLLLVGGVVNAEGKQTISASTLFVSLGADGKVAGTTPGPDLPQGAMHDTCDLAGDSIYVMGGRGSKGVSTDLSARARIGADGTIGAWEVQTPLTPKRSHHASFVRGKRLYLVGGLDGNPVGDSAKQLTDVVFADLADDGSLGAWTPAGKLPVSVEVSSATLYKDAVYLVGGVEDNASFSAAIRRATFDADGTVTKFTELPVKLPNARGHVHETPMNGPIFYSVGGQNDDGDSLGTVDIGTFSGG
jgi:N-acetylneuraminic acid mutarotase